MSCLTAMDASGLITGPIFSCISVYRSLWIGGDDHLMSMEYVIKHITLRQHKRPKNKCLQFHQLRWRGVTSIFVTFNFHNCKTFVTNDIFLTTSLNKNQQNSPLHTNILYALYLEAYITNQH